MKNDINNQCQYEPRGVAQWSFNQESKIPGCQRFSENIAVYILSTDILVRNM
jgi:hypothetical protein